MQQHVTITDEFVFFWRGWPSQWYPSPFEIEGERYTCAEQYMMAEKARFFFGAHPDNARILEAIMATKSPKEHKALGGSVRGFDDGAWVGVVREIVYTGNLAKFTQNGELRQLLLETGELTIVEASPVDARWGIGLAADDPRALDRRQWNGLNWLGEAIMRVRETIRKGPSRGAELG